MTAVRSLRFDELDVDLLYRILQLRSQVFVVEQDCVYLDLDGRDTEPTTVHWVAESDGQVIATLRWLDDGECGRIGRVVCALPHRRTGLARKLMVAVLGATSGPVVLDAQTPSADWYASLGFAVSGDEFVEDGIPHVPMRLSRDGATLHR